jgi:hypothetical protein
MTVNGGATGPTVLSNFFAAAPGPLAQIKWGNSTTATDGQFDHNTFANMNWFAIEFDTAGTYDLRGIKYSGNGTNRDILASHDTGTVTLNNSETGDTPGVTNGTTINVTMVGACDAFAVAVVTYEEVHQTTDGTDVVVGAGGVPLVTQSTGSLSADADTFAVSAAVPGPPNTLTYTGASDQYTDDKLMEMPSVGGGFLARVGLDEVTPGAGTRTGFPVHDGTETEGVQGLVHINEAVASTPVVRVDPEFRPWQLVTGASTVTFGYGAGSTADGPRKTYVVVVALDGVAANTAVSTLTIDTGASTQTLVRRTSWPSQDDNVGSTGRSLELDVWDIDEDTSYLEQGSVDINNAVTTAVQGVTEGSSILMYALETVGDVTAGDTILGMSGIADESGQLSAAQHNYQGDIDVRTVVRNGGLLNASVQNDGGTYTDKLSGANTSTANTMDLFSDGAMATSDEHYFGCIEQFEELVILVSTAGGGTYTLLWEYYNGSGWSTLTVSAALDSDLQVAGREKISFTAPGNWVVTAVPNDGTTTNLYYIRAVVQVGTISATPDGQWAVVGPSANRYQPFTQDGTIKNTGLVVTATWVRDLISRS